MAVCSFVGHKNVYDVDIEVRLQSAAERVVNENEEVTFMLQPSSLGGFFEYCLSAAMRERARCPEKVKIAIVLGKDQPCPLNTGAFDSVIIPSLPEPKNGSSFVIYERMMKWIVKNSTHIIKYTYEKLHDMNVRFLKLNSNMEIIDITSPETEQAILDRVPIMTEREQMIFHKINEGYTLKETGEMLDISNERVRQLLQKGCRKLRENMVRRYRSLQNREMD